MTINGGTVTTTGTLNVGNNLLISSGILDCATNNSPVNVTVNATGAGTLNCGSGTAVVSGLINLNSFQASSTTTTLNGNLTVPTANFNANGGTFIFNGNTTILQDMTFNNIQINGADTLNITGRNITVHGNWDNSAGGTLTNTGSTVTFDTTTTSTISGSTTFNNFTCSASGKQINFTAGTTQIINGTLTLTGNSGVGNLIVLRSTSSPTVWQIRRNGGQIVSSVDVQDSEVIGVNNINASNSKDSGHNDPGGSSQLDFRADRHCIGPAQEIQYGAMEPTGWKVIHRTLATAQ